MSFYDPLQAGPDIGGGLNDLMSQFMMYKLIQQMYPKLKKGKKGKQKIGETPLGGQSGVLSLIADLFQLYPPPSEFEEEPGRSW